MKHIPDKIEQAPEVIPIVFFVPSVSSANLVHFQKSLKCYLWFLTLLTSLISWFPILNPFKAYFISPLPPCRWCRLKHQVIQRKVKWLPFRDCPGDTLEVQWKTFDTCCKYTHHHLTWCKCTLTKVRHMSAVLPFAKTILSQCQKNVRKNVRKLTHA